MPAPLSARARRALVAGPGLMISGVLPAFLTASLASRIPDDFALGDTGVGLAIAIFHVMCALTSTPAGRLVERIGPQAGMRIAATLTALSCLAIAGLALPLVAIPFGWRWAFLAVAALALTAAALAPSGAAVRVAAADRPRGLTSVHALAVAAALASAAGVGFISFLILYAERSGMSQAAAGLLLGAVSLAATVSRIGVGLLADRRGQEPLRPVAGMLALSIGGYLLLIAGEPALIVIAALLAGSAGWAWPGGLTLAVVQRSPGAPAWAVGVLMAGLFTGAILGPLMVGVLAEHERFAVAWGVCATCALLAAITVSATRRRPPRPQPRP
jgi:predicted MFS family arabinose efflux permease